jgi:hypothetical protein
MAFAKIKTLIRKAAARTYDQLWQAVGNVCNLFKDEECYTASPSETEFNVLTAGFGTIHLC